MMGADNWQGSTVFLVSCVGKKRDAPAAARRLYISEWFLRAQEYVEATGCPWFILSAKYGLTSPDEIVAPYERTLNQMGISERREWASRVKSQMEERLPEADRFVIFAGQRYREFLSEYLSRRATFEVPLEGLRIGEQLSWFGRHGPSR